jgi:Tat protein translocase TatB subunit
MFGTLGGPELFLIFVVALIVFGPRKLPEIGKSLGKMMAEFRKASNDFRSTIESEVEAEKIRESMRIDLPKVEPVPAPAAPSPEASPATDPSASGYPETPPEHESAGDATVPGGTSVPETVSRQPDPTPIEPK